MRDKMRWMLCCAPYLLLTACVLVSTHQARNVRDSIEYLETGMFI